MSIVATPRISTSSWPRRLLTLADWDRMPEDRLHHVECAEGVLVVTPNPLARHQYAMVNLAHLLDSRLPSDLVALADFEMLITEAPLTVRIPDVVVMPRSLAGENPHRIPADQVRLAIEIMSPGSRRIDRVMKLNEYGEAGIPEYWILDPANPSVLVVHHADAGGGYRCVGKFSGRFTVETCAASVDIDLDALTTI